MSYWSFEQRVSDDDAIHYGRLGMKWHQNIYKSSRTPDTDDANDISKWQSSKLTIEKYINKLKDTNKKWNSHKDTISAGKKYINSIIYKNKWNKIIRF